MTRTTTFFEGWYWFQFNDLGPALAITLKFYTSVTKGLKLKVRKFLRINLTFVEVTGEKSSPHPEQGYEMIFGSMKGIAPPKR